MKFLLAMMTVGLAGYTSSVCGQEPPLPSKTVTASPSPQPTANQPDHTMPIEPPQLVPASPAPGSATLLPTTPDLSRLDAAFKQSPLGQEAEEHRLHVEWRQLQNRTAHDPEVLAAKKAADAARTDLEKRLRLRAYYNIYYAHMQALTTALDVKIYLEVRRRAFLAALAQPKVRPEPSPHADPALSRERPND